MSLVERVRQLAKTDKLKGIWYFDKYGRTARGKAVVDVKLDFWSGESIQLPLKDLPEDVEFQLVSNNEIN